jgi:hypothetical protein
MPRCDLLELTMDEGVGEGRGKSPPWSRAHTRAHSPPVTHASAYLRLASKPPRLLDRAAPRRSRAPSPSQCTPADRPSIHRASAPDRSRRGAEVWIPPPDRPVNSCTVGIGPESYTTSGVFWVEKRSTGMVSRWGGFGSDTTC